MNIYTYIFGNNSGRAGIAGITNDMRTFKEMSEPMSDSEIISLVTNYINEDDLITLESKVEMLSELNKEIIAITKDHEELFNDYKKFVQNENGIDLDDES